MEDTNLTYDSCKNCQKVEEEACRLELAWAAEIRMNNKLKNEYAALQSQCTEKEKECEELEDKLDSCQILYDACKSANQEYFKLIEELKAENERLKDAFLCEHCGQLINHP